MLLYRDSKTLLFYFTFGTLFSSLMTCKLIVALGAGKFYNFLFEVADINDWFISSFNLFVICYFISSGSFMTKCFDYFSLAYCSWDCDWYDFNFDSSSFVYSSISFLFSISFSFFSISSCFFSSYRLFYLKNALVFYFLILSIYYFFFYNWVSFY